MSSKFDTCSYDELTACVKARVKWIREGRRFLDDMNTQTYGYVRSSVRMGILLHNSDIRSLMKMRRLLKKSGCRSWDSNTMILTPIKKGLGWDKAAEQEQRSTEADKRYGH